MEIEDVNQSIDNPNKDLIDEQQSQSKEISYCHF
jgi:hypothetical protein